MTCVYFLFLFFQESNEDYNIGVLTGHHHNVRDMKSTEGLLFVEHNIRGAD